MTYYKSNDDRNPDIFCEQTGQRWEKTSKNQYRKIPIGTYFIYLDALKKKHQVTKITEEEFFLELL